MEEIVKAVAEKTGLSEDMARTVVSVVLDFLKEKLPAPLANQLDSLFGSPNGGKRNDLAKELLGLFGRN